MFQYYRFIAIPDVASAVSWFQEAAADLLGTVLIAPEGINLSLAGEDRLIESFIANLQKADCPCPPDPQGISRRITIDRVPYRRLLVRERREIVTFKEKIDPSLNDGHFLTPAEFHQRMHRGDIVPVDTRNLYESKIGSFRGAVHWPIDRFSDLPEHLDVLEPLRDKEIVTFCTGGIRCEKVVPFLRSRGFSRVWQIKGGIQDYLAEYPDGFWEGECFVFDERFSIRSDGSEGTARPCHRCGQPIYRGSCVGCGHTESIGMAGISTAPQKTDVELAGTETEEMG